MRRRLAAALASAALPAALLLGAIGASPAAAVGGTALIDDATVVGPSSLEEQAAVAAGFTVTVVPDATWALMTQAQFGAYDLLIAGDPSCSDLPSGLVSSASVWGPVVLGAGGGRTQAGNRIIVGTDPALHDKPTLINEGIAFAGAQPGRTGMYLDTSCDSTQALTVVNAISSPAASGAWTIDGDPPCGGNVSLIASVPGSFPTLSTAYLQGWGCSVHESFPTFTSDFAALAVATDTTSHPTCGIDPDTKLSACGEAYILVAGLGIIVTSGSISLTPADVTNPVGTDHTVTANVTDVTGAALVGQVVEFSVTGINAGATGICVPVTCASDSLGNVTFTYHDTNGAGDDTIKASFTDAAESLQTATAQKHWTSATGTLTFVKVVSGGSATTGDFILTYVATDSTTGTAGTAKSGNVKTLPLSTYTVGENLAGGPANYVLDSVSCVPNVTDGALAPAETNQAFLSGNQPNWTCTITNHFVSAPPPPPVPVVGTACGGSVTFTNVLAGWTYRIDSTTGTATAVTTTSVGPLAESVGSHTYQFMNAAGAIVASGSFTIVDCSVTPPPTPSVSPSPSPSVSPSPSPSVGPSATPVVTPRPATPPPGGVGAVTPPPTSTIRAASTGSDSPLVPLSIALLLIAATGLVFVRRPKSR